MKVNERTDRLSQTYGRTSHQTHDISERGKEQRRRKTKSEKTRPDTRHKMRLVCVLFAFENNTGPSYGRTDGPTDGHDLIWRCDGASKN